MTDYILYNPPTWRNVAMIAGPLRVGVPTSTCVYRRGGVWHNVLTAGEMDVAGVDVWVDPTDNSQALALFFVGPTLVPVDLQAELQAVRQADPSWSAAYLGLVAPLVPVTPPIDPGPPDGTSVFTDNGDGTFTAVGLTDPGDGTFTAPTLTPLADGTWTAA